MSVEPKLWDGTQYVSALDNAKLWDGSGFVAPTGAYEWDGGQFVQVWSPVPPFEPHTVTITTTGAFSVDWPAGATAVDVAVCGSGSGGTTATTYNGIGAASTVSAGSHSLSAPGGGSPVGTFVTSEAETDGQDMPASTGPHGYDGAAGGAHGTIVPTGYTPVPGGAGGRPGAGGAGSWFAPASQGVPGGLHAQWAFDTWAFTDPPSAVTGTVAAGGPGADAVPGYHVSAGVILNIPKGGDGGDGIAHLYFHT